MNHYRTYPLENVEKLLKIPFFAFGIITILFFLLLPITFPVSVVFWPHIGFSLIFLLLTIYSYFQYKVNANQSIIISNGEILLYQKNELVTVCKIDKISEIYIQDFHRLDFLVIVDTNNKLNSSGFYLNKKGYCIRMEYNIERKKMLESISGKTVSRKYTPFVRNH